MRSNSSNQINFFEEDVHGYGNEKCVFSVLSVRSDYIFWSSRPLTLNPRAAYNYAPRPIRLYAARIYICGEAAKFYRSNIVVIIEVVQVFTKGNLP